jgi:HNH endonuclease
MAAPSTAAATYAAKLKDPRWQKKRLESLELADWSCEVCGDGRSTLHVHHKQYFKGRDPWEYDPDQLAVLCESCHESLHTASDPLLDVISRLPIEGQMWIDRDKAAALLAGVMGLEDYTPTNNVLEAWHSAGMHVQEIVNRMLFWKEGRANA